MNRTRPARSSLRATRLGRVARGRWAPLLAALCLPVLLSGCLDYTEILTLNHDGGGSLEAEFTLDMGLLRDLSRAWGQAPEPGELSGPTRNELLAALSVEGVTVRDLEVRDQGSKTAVRLRLEFEDLDALHRIDGFSARRRLDLYEQADGQVLLVSRFDPREVIPLEEVAGQGPDGTPPSTRDRLAAVELVRTLRRATRLRSEIRLPGPIVASNGHPDAAAPGFNVGAWSFDAQRSPDRHADLGRHVVLMKVLCDASSVPWAQALAPVPSELGSVHGDALAQVTSTSTATPAVSAAEAPDSSPRSERGESGCSLSPKPTPGPAGALSLLLLAAGLIARRLVSPGR